jgi:cyclopropane-fatty-acyl-phospholipid synthase
VLEIGCGWGAFAEMAAREFGCRVTGLTLSEEQLAYADARMHRAGVADRVEIAFRDYRDERGTYDHVVSIEMYEAVGERYWPTYFGTIADRVKPGGRALVQAITIADRLFERYRTGTDFIQQYVFPGGMLASPGRFRAEAAGAGLRVEGELAFGRDYAETLRRWRRAFKARLPEARALGYEERFLRTWDFYLAYCEAGFATECTDVIHFELARPV